MRSVRHRVLLRLHWCVHSLHPSEALEKLACCIPSAPGHEPCMRMGEGCDDHARVCVDSDRLVDVHQLLIWKVRHSARCVRCVCHSALVTVNDTVRSSACTDWALSPLLVWIAGCRWQTRPYCDASPVGSNPGRHL